jgi:hypothetical protein
MNTCIKSPSLFLLLGSKKYTQNSFNLRKHRVPISPSLLLLPSEKKRAQGNFNLRQHHAPTLPLQTLRRSGKNHAQTSLPQPLHRSQKTATALPMKCSGSNRRQGVFLWYKNNFVPQNSLLCEAEKNCSKVAI